MEGIGISIFPTSFRKYCVQMKNFTTEVRTFRYFVIFNLSLGHKMGHVVISPGGGGGMMGMAQSAMSSGLLGKKGAMAAGMMGGMGGHGGHSGHGAHGGAGGWAYSLHFSMIEVLEYFVCGKRMCEK